MTTRLLLCRTIWLNHYDGRANDPPYGAHGWVRDGNTPHESKNFLPTEDGKLLGFVQIRRWGRISLERLGADIEDDQLNGVTVVWCAQHPDKRGLVIVGWYRNAIVYRHAQDSPKGWAVDEGRSVFRMTAPARESKLIDSSLRDVVIQPSGLPRSKMIFGQSDLCYVAQRFPKLSQRILAYVHGQQRISTDAARQGRIFGGEVDLEKNARVERAAIEVVKAHYAGWSCTDVSKKDHGWDLEFTLGATKRYVEVKGRSPSSPAPVVLTRNEREQFERASQSPKFSDCYRLAVVHAAVTRPTLRLFRHRPVRGWRCELTNEGILTEPLGLLVKPDSAD